MKAIFEYDNGKKYHTTVNEVMYCNDNIVQYSTKGTKWENGYRMDYTHTIDVLRSGLISVTFVEWQDSVKRETKYVFKQSPRKKENKYGF